MKKVKWIFMLSFCGCKCHEVKGLTLSLLYFLFDLWVILQAET